ncbi:MAG: hypothetical protein AAFU03_01925 [Bacteroidota bacterium]
MNNQLPSNHQGEIFATVICTIAKVGSVRIFALHHMNMRYSFFLALLPLVACRPELVEEQKIDLSKELVGTWEVIELKTTNHSYLGEDTTFVLDIKEADWGRLYGVKPFRTEFINDGKLKRTHYLLNGNITDVVNGLWKVTGDSLRIIEPNITFYYMPTLDGEKLTLTGRVDNDQDGEVDDDYYASFRLVSRTR